MNCERRGMTLFCLYLFMVACFVLLELLTHQKLYDLSRLDDFMAGFNAISLKLKEMYQVSLSLSLSIIEWMAGFYTCYAYFGPLVFN